MEQVTVSQLLKCDLKGKIVCFPTDTVYGVGALYNDLEAVNKIYQMKKRDPFKPLAFLTPNKQIGMYVKNISPEAQDLIDKYWPGALTLIFQKSSLVSDEVTRGYQTIAIRMPNSQIALSILKHFGLMATTSVNLSGEKELNTLLDIEKQFAGYIDYLVTDQEQMSVKPSTIIDVSDKEIKIIRK